MCLARTSERSATVAGLVEKRQLGVIVPIASQIGTTAGVHLR